MEILGKTILKNFNKNLGKKYICLTHISKDKKYYCDFKIKLKCKNCNTEKQYSIKTVCYKDINCKCYNYENKILELNKKYNCSNITNFYYDKKNKKTYIQYKCLKCNKILTIRSDNFNPDNLLCNECNNINKTLEIQNILDNKFGKIYEIKTIYNGYHNYITVKCLKCNYEYEITPANIIAGKRCINCSNLQSKACDKIDKFLNDNNIHYVKEFTFDDLKYKKHLRFDYAIFNNSKLELLIEYNGKQHYINEQWGDNFELCQKRDNIKKEYCKKNNLKLLIIPYTQESNIENILKSNLNFENKK